MNSFANFVGYPHEMFHEKILKNSQIEIVKVGTSNTNKKIGCLSIIEQFS